MFRTNGPKFSKTIRGGLGSGSNLDYGSVSFAVPEAGDAGGETIMIRQWQRNYVKIDHPFKQKDY